MKEQLHTIPISEGFEMDDECPFCAVERDVEQRSIRYVVGPSATYMEPHVRAATGRWDSVHTILNPYTITAITWARL